MGHDTSTKVVTNNQIHTSFPRTGHRFVSFDGGVVVQGLLQRPDRYRFWTPGTTFGPLIARGAGLSYAAASFSQGGLSVEHGSFNRILDFDSDRGIVEVEAGTELFALYEFLSSRGLYLPIQPGHGRITVGGCIAADVHGKNQAKDGTFINQVVGLTLFHPEHGVIEISSTTEPALFRLTCGGYGLTGHILKARLQAIPIPSNVVEIIATPVEDVSSGIYQFIQAAIRADFTYTWHDFMAKGLHFGRGYIFLGRFVPADEISDAIVIHGHNNISPPLSAEERKGWRLPLLNCYTTQALNFAYRSKQFIQGRIRRVKLYDVLFPIHETQFYFKLFGIRGFHEYQVIMPIEHITDYLNAVRNYLAHHSLAVTLASAKLFGGQRELLRFTGEGICFALNFPRTSEASSFLTFLDELVVTLGGIPNIIKDSRLPRSVLEACYPEVQRFRDQLHVFDPKHLFRSELSERLGL
jgi:decaprenylphospho-beta-D-ribofuranose 2-oxidase